MTKDIESSTVINKKPIIALDCDGVLLDYHRQFAQIYEKTFGIQLSIVLPKSYHARIEYGVSFTDEEKAQFDKTWDAHGWRSMPMHDGSLQACHALHQAGYELVCVTAMPAHFIQHRLENFREHGFPIDRIISSGYDKDNFNNNPKRKIIEELHPVIFVDDLRRNFKDITHVSTKFVFIDHERHDDPNRNDQIYYDVKYPSLLQFVDDFLQSEQHGENVRWSERPSHLIPSISS